MSLFRTKRFSVFLAALVAFAFAIGSQSSFAQDVAHALSGVVKSVDKGTKTFVVKTADGTEQVFHMADHAAVETGKGAEKSAKVTVYYTEDAGKKVAHFFEKH